MACAYPINLCNSLGLGPSDLHHCVGCGRGPWLESIINFPFLPVALSWRPSLFLLRDSDIGHNTVRPGVLQFMGSQRVRCNWATEPNGAASFRPPRPNLPVIPGVSGLPTLTLRSPLMKKSSFWGISSRKSCRFSGTIQLPLLQHYWSRHRLEFS